jgi:hypothetical protein
MSSAEAELIALCACAADVAYCRRLANELGFLQLRPTIIHEDNVGAHSNATCNSLISVLLLAVILKCKACVP